MVPSGTEAAGLVLQTADTTTVILAMRLVSEMEALVPEWCTVDPCCYMYICHYAHYMIFALLVQGTEASCPLPPPRDCGHDITIAKLKAHIQVCIDYIRTLVYQTVFHLG